MRSRADSNPSGGIDLSMTERENFDLALGIQASIGEIETTGDRVTNTNVDRPVRPVRQTPSQPTTEESQTCCPICLDVIVRGGTGGDRERVTEEAWEKGPKTVCAKLSTLQVGQAQEGPGLSPIQ